MTSSIVTALFSTAFGGLSEPISCYSCYSQSPYPPITSPCVWITFLPPPEKALKPNSTKESIFNVYLLLPFSSQVLYSHQLSTMGSGLLITRDGNLLTIKEILVSIPEVMFCFWIPSSPTPDTKGELTKKDQFKNKGPLDFPGDAVVKNPPANAGDTGSSPGPGRSHRLWSN